MSETTEFERTLTIWPSSGFMWTYHCMMRRLLAIGSSAVLVLGLAIGVTPSASAADLGSVTVSYSSGTYGITPSVLSGGAGDTFTLRNTLTSGDNASNFYVALQNETGSVSLGGTSCSTATDCQVLDLFAGTATGSFTVTGTGTVKVMRFYQTSPATQIGTITVGDGGSGAAVTDPALVYPTASIDANGGTCTGSTQYIKYQGQNAASGTFTAPTADTCTRTNFSLAGWARSATGSVEW